MANKHVVCFQSAATKQAKNKKSDDVQQTETSVEENEEEEEEEEEIPQLVPIATPTKKPKLEVSAVCSCSFEMFQQIQLFQIVVLQTLVHCLFVCFP